MCALLIVGEKLNGTLKDTAAAIAGRDEVYIQDMALRQAEAGADFLDLNAGTGAAPAQEPDDLIWLVDTVQAVTDVRLCLDSANPAAVAAALGRAAQPPLINSISGEKARLEGILPLLAGRAWGAIALLLDDSGIPPDVEGRLRVGRDLIEQTRAAGVADEQLYIDPLAIALSTRQDGALVAFETMRALREEYPQVHFGIGLSNASFGLPGRKVLNRVFLSHAMAAGLDLAIMDPLDDGLVSEMLATEVLLGRDRFCRRYTRAFKAGRVTW
jgi:5-methyltetrahydrofolate--homocysteine methyltransferase